jgi:serine/threonine-protein kinase
VLDQALDDREAAEARIGQRLRGKWTLDGLLGVGGMAAVYSATHKIGRRDAIKILHPHVSLSPQLRARFEREAQAANRFRHPGAVEVRDIDVTEDGSPFLVMELLEGESLSARLRRDGTMPPDELLAHVDVLLDVLKAAHGEGVIHRDIKADNLFLTRNGDLKVLDFGVARMLENSGKPITQLGMRIGTLPYMPPEQIRGQPVDARADLFAVGATMFRALSGRRVHEAANEADLLVKMTSQAAPALASVASTIAPGVCQIVDRALALEREQRYPDAATMQLDVRATRDGKAPPYAVAASAGDEDALRALAASLVRDGAPSSATAATTIGQADDTGKGVSGFEPTVVEGSAANGNVAGGDAATAATRVGTGTQRMQATVPTPAEPTAVSPGMGAHLDNTKVSSGAPEAAPSSRTPHIEVAAISTPASGIMRTQPLPAVAAPAEPLPPTAPPPLVAGQPADDDAGSGRWWLLGIALLVGGVAVLWWMGREVGRESHESSEQLVRGAGAADDETRAAAEPSAAAAQNTAGQSGATAGASAPPAASASAPPPASATAASSAATSASAAPSGQPPPAQPAPPPSPKTTAQPASPPPPKATAQPAPPPPPKATAQPAPPPPPPAAAAPTIPLGTGKGKSKGKGKARDKPKKR